MTWFLLAAAAVLVGANMSGDVTGRGPGPLGPGSLIGTGMAVLALVVHLGGAS